MSLLCLSEEYLVIYSEQYLRYVESADRLSTMETIFVKPVELTSHSIIGMFLFLFVFL